MALCEFTSLENSNAIINEVLELKSYNCLMKNETSKISETKNPPLEGREASSSLINEDLAPVAASKQIGRAHV